MEVPYRLHLKIANHDASSPIEHLRFTPEMEAYLDAKPSAVQLQYRQWFRWWERDGMYMWLVSRYDVALVDAVYSVKCNETTVAKAARKMGRTERWLSRQIRIIQDDARYQFS